jgi:hypothetical protein
MQPLPVLIEAQVKVVGPVQPEGKALNPEVMDSPVAVSPSSVVKVTLNVALDPTATLTLPAGEAVATMLSFVFVVVGGGEYDPPPPHAANMPKVAAMAELPSNFQVLIIGFVRSIYIKRLLNCRFNRPIHIESIPSTSVLGAQSRATFSTR